MWTIIFTVYVLNWNEKRVRVQFGTNQPVHSTLLSSIRCQQCIGLAERAKQQHTRSTSKISTGLLKGWAQGPTKMSRDYKILQHIERSTSIVVCVLPLFFWALQIWTIFQCHESYYWRLGIKFEGAQVSVLRGWISPVSWNMKVGRIVGARWRLFIVFSNGVIYSSDASNTSNSTSVYYPRPSFPEKDFCAILGAFDDTKEHKLLLNYCDWKYSRAWQRSE